MTGNKGHQKSRKQRKQTGFKELAHICVLCSAIASPSLLSSSPIRVNPIKFDCAILAWPVLLYLVNAFVNGSGSLVQTPVGSLSHFVSGMSIACGTCPSTACIRGCISAMGLSLGGRYRWFYIFICVSGWQSSFRFYLDFYHMYMYRAVSLRRLVYRRTRDSSRTFVTIVVRTAVFRARGPGSMPSRCSLPLTSEFASRSGSPYPALNTHLGGFACGPRLGCGGKASAS